MLLLRKREFRPYWFETGTPTFLVDMLAESGTAPLDLEEMVVSERLLSAFEADHIAIEALLFQTGYLTIRETLDGGGPPWYRLAYPNQEVRQALSEVPLPHLIDASDLDALQGLRRGFAPVAQPVQGRSARGVLRIGGLRLPGHAGGPPDGGGQRERWSRRHRGAGRGA